MFIRPVIAGIPIVTFMRPSLEIDTPVEIDLEALVTGPHRAC